MYGIDDDDDDGGGVVNDWDAGDLILLLYFYPQGHP